MGFFNYMFDSDLMQRADIEELRYRHRRERRKARRTKYDHKRQIEVLEDEVDELELLVAALVGLLKDKGAFTAEELAAALGTVRLQEAEAEAERKAEEREAFRRAAPKRTQPRRLND